MKKNEYHVVGVMSGTSLDGIDLVEANFYFDGSWQFEIVRAETVSYNKNWQQKLANLVSLSMEELEGVDKDYSVLLAEVVKGFIQNNSIENIDAVCSHGHTALHQPDNKLTLQIGNKSVVSKILNETVVCDFRVQDVELGGQGAPLVPIGDKLLFAEYDYCLNLGGFGNISTEINKERIAYDICPVNIVLNYYVRELGFDFDNGGQIASSGELNKPLLFELNALDFYTEKPPKSLGLEWVNNMIFPIIDSFKLKIEDILNTLVEHIAVQITAEITSKKDATVLITGGGAYHRYLVDRIKHHSKQDIVIPKEEIIEFKEALIFGFLGVLKLRDEVNCLQSVTGASKSHSSGVVFLP